MPQRISRRLLALLLPVLMLLAACETVDTAEHENTPEPTGSAPAANGSLAAFESELASLYERINPSVVNIQVVMDGPSAPGGAGGRVGAGSGWVWDEEGHIVTNNHVIDGADEVTVTFHDGTQASAEVVGADPDSDLAVLRVDMPPDRLEPIALADFDSVAVGHMAIAIGNPFGLQGTMTTGTVSGLGRTLPSRTVPGAEGVYTIPDIVQTDADLNPGNSGGVLLNWEGELIGVPSAGIEGDSGAVGTGFAIPGPIVERVAPALIAEGAYEYSWLGTSVTTVTPDLAEAMELDPDLRGAMVVTVQDGSPAEEAGLQEADRTAIIRGQEVPIGGDVIVAIDGSPVATSDDLIAYQVRNTEPGQEIELTVLRDGEEQVVTATLGTRPTE